MKKKMKKVLSVGLAVLMIAQVAGCGEKKNASSGEKITLMLWTKPTQDATQDKILLHDARMEDLKTKFPEVNFVEEIRPAGSDYRQEYDKALMANRAPAFMDLFSYTDIQTRIENGTIADITKYVEDWDLRKEGKILDIFDENITDDNGNWYAIASRAYTQASLYNVRLMEELGEARIPETWEEFAQMGERVTDFSVPRVGYALMGMDWCAWPFCAWVWSAGGEMIRENEDGTSRVAFNEPEGVDAAMFWNEMVWKYKMTQKDVLMSLSDISKMVLTDGAVCAFETFDPLGGTMAKNLGTNPSDYRMMPIPSKNSNIKPVALAGGEVVTFSPKLSETELEKAVEVAKYYYFSDEQMQIQCEHLKETNGTNIQIPGRVDWYERKLDANALITEEMKQSLLELRQYGKPEPAAKDYTLLKSAIAKYLQEILLTENISREKCQQILNEAAMYVYRTYPNSFHE